MDAYICLLTDEYGIVRSTSTIEAHALETAITVATQATRSQNLQGFELWQSDQRVARVIDIFAASAPAGPRYRA